VRINLLQIEMDGNDAGAIVRGLTEAMQGGAARPAAVTAATGREACPTALVEAPEAPATNGHRKYVRRLKPAPRAAKAQQAEQITGKPPGVREAIRLALADGPKSNMEVQEFLHGVGVQATNVSVSTALCQMRAENQIYKGDQDLKWRPALNPRGR